MDKEPGLSYTGFAQSSQRTFGMRSTLAAASLSLLLAACPGKGGGNDAGAGCPGGCPIHETCTAGTCQCLAGWITCPSADAGQACTEVQADNRNCGACGTVCPAGETCLGGTCSCTAAQCPGPDGGLTCSDLQSDPANCGECGQACPPNETCVGAFCQCPSGNSLCPLPDGGAVCTDLSTDPNNCGQCAALCDGGDCQCDPQTQVCSAPAEGEPGVCTCLGTLTACGANGGDCVDTNSDPQNCGGCGQVCPTGNCAGGTCACTLPYHECPAAGGKVCTDWEQDVHNCGSCGNDCALQGGNLPGITCANGECGCAADGGGGANSGTICQSGGAPACVDLTSDPVNCGKCGNACLAPTTACQNGNCSCPSPQQLCGGTGASSCVDVTSSATNCGACGNDCTAVYAAQSTCAQGHCGCSDKQVLCLDGLSPLACSCEAADGGGACVQPKIAFSDVAAILTDATSAYGCATCHSQSAHQGGLDLSSPSAAYGALLGGGDGGSGPPGACDGGPGGGFGAVPSEACPCTARVVPGLPGNSFLIQTLTDSPSLCAGAQPMPVDADGGFHALSPCQIQLLTVWIAQGAVGPP